MTERLPDASANDAIALLARYSFDLGGHGTERLVAYWSSRYPVNWLYLAVIEALYQGRYKAISVEQLLVFWQRRGKPLYRFNHEFERMICNRPKDNGDGFRSTERSPDRPNTSESSLPRRSTGGDLPVDSPFPALPLPSDLAFTTDSGDQPIQPFKPNPSQGIPLLESAPAPPTEEAPLTHHPIHQFIPATEASEFYLKLKLAAQNTDNPKADPHHRREE